MEPMPPTAEVLDYAAPGRAAARPPRPPVVRIVVLGLVLFPLIVVAVYPVARSVQVGWLTVAVTDVPAGKVDESGRPIEFRIVANGTGRGASVPMTRVFVHYGRQYPFVIVADPRGMTREAGRGVDDPRGGVPLTSESLRAQLEANWFDPAPGEAARLADAIEAEVLNLAAGRLPASEVSPDAGPRPPGGYRYSYMLGTYWPRGMIWWPWYTGWCIPVWLLAWVLLGRWLLGRHRRRLARLDVRSAS